MAPPSTKELSPPAVTTTSGGMPNPYWPQGYADTYPYNGGEPQFPAPFPGNGFDQQQLPQQPPQQQLPQMIQPYQQIKMNDPAAAAVVATTTAEQPMPNGLCSPRTNRNPSYIAAAAAGGGQTTSRGMFVVQL